MKVRVFDEKPIEDRKREFFLRLVQSGKSVDIVLVDPDGIKVQGGMLLRIKHDMKLFRYRGVNDTLGLPLDEKGSLKLTESID